VAHDSEAQISLLYFPLSIQSATRSERPDMLTSEKKAGLVFAILHTFAHHLMLHSSFKASAFSTKCHVQSRPPKVAIS
jgi:hypothetical protein